MHLYIERPLCFPEFIYAFKGLKVCKDDRMAWTNSRHAFHIRGDIVHSKTKKKLHNRKMDREHWRNGRMIGK